MPSTWTTANGPPPLDITDQVAAAVSFEDGVFRVVPAAVPPDGLYGRRPHTVHPAAECGAPGLYVQVPADFLASLDLSSPSGREVAGQEFVHAWAQFRYGIFDELGYPGDRLFPAFYFRPDHQAEADNVTVAPPLLAPNFCTNTEHVDYHMEDMAGRGACTYDRATGLPDGSCLAVATTTSMGDDGASDTHSSVMALPYVAGHNQFCDDEDEALYLHDPALPSKQNLFCDGKSAFAIARKHEDLKGYRPGFQIADRTVRFERVAAAPTTSFLVLIDASYTMTWRLEQLKDALLRWILYDISEGGTFYQTVL